MMTQILVRTLRGVSPSSSSHWYSRAPSVEAVPLALFLCVGAAATADKRRGLAEKGVSRDVHVEDKEREEGRGKS